MTSSLGASHEGGPEMPLALHAVPGRSSRMSQTSRCLSSREVPTYPLVSEKNGDMSRIAPSSRGRGASLVPKGRGGTKAEPDPFAVPLLGPLSFIGFLFLAIVRENSEIEIHLNSL